MREKTMKQKKLEIIDGIEYAANVYFGEYVPYEVESIITYETPESILISRSLLEEISADAKIALDLIFTKFDTPENCLENGKMRKMKIKKLLREELKWSFRKALSVLQELKNLVKSF